MRPWTTAAQARAAVAFADQTIDEDDALATEFLASLPRAPSPRRGAPQRMDLSRLPSAQATAAAIAASTLLASAAPSIKKSLVETSTSPSLTWFFSEPATGKDNARVAHNGRSSPIFGRVPSPVPQTGVFQ